MKFLILHFIQYKLVVTSIVVIQIHHIPITLFDSYTLYHELVNLFFREHELVAIVIEATLEKELYYCCAMTF